MLRSLYLVAVFARGIGLGLALNTGCESCGGCATPPYCDEAEEADPCSCGCLADERSCEVFDGQHFIVGCDGASSCLERTPCPADFVCVLPEGEAAGAPSCEPS